MTTRAATVACALWLGCVPSARELRAPIDSDLERDLGAPRVPASEIDVLLAKPVDETAAVRIALAASPRLAAALDELGIAGSELAAATVLGPTAVDVQLRFGAHDHEYELDAIQPVLGLIEMPRRRAAAHADIAAARATAEAAAVQLAARVEIAWHDLLAAQQELELRRTAFDAADAAATLRERMHAAGNTTDLAQARDRDAREYARIALGRAEAAIELRREALNALLGLSGDRTKWTATGTLRELPLEPPQLDALETTAVAASLQLVAERAHAEAAANTLGVERMRAFVPELGVGASVIDRDAGAELGPAIRLGLPLFDQRQGPRARAAAELHHAEHETEAVAVELRARARAVRIAALAAYAEARHLRDIVLPLRQQIVDETLLHYNAMDADPFQLILARQGLVDASRDYLDAVRRYWNASSEATALGRGAMLEPSAPEAP